ncbi:hypothetical protein ILUMI_03920 [Ignelater luminosus]|uniref:Uncharacterized protein n=1 Tax=Ignelater luminosus TaxID=2038154 RepID=A0A8K0DEW0_IGNLU|nr:hypothetical protein ILUMI_03920 [Ignelater luminosus]
MERNSHESTREKRLEGILEEETTTITQLNHLTSERIQQEKNSEWLSGDFEFPKFGFTINTRLHLGRPTLPYEKKSTRSQQRDAAKLSSENQQQTGLIMKAAGIVARATEQSDLAAVLKEVSKSPTRPSKIRTTLINSEKFSIPLNNEEALTFLLNNNFSKQQYILLMKTLKKQN